MQLQWGRDLSIAEMKGSAPSDRAVLLLQWGRDLSIAEIAVATSSFPSINGLQWGRDLSIAEMRLPLRLPTRHSLGFNGAAIFRSRKSAGLPDEPHSSGMLQWGRDLSIAEMESGRR
jgi:hypothetical protein